MSTLNLLLILMLHSLHYFYTASSGLSTFPEFVSVGMVDGVQFEYYDSNIQRTVLKQDWMDQVTSDDPYYLERTTGSLLVAQQSSKVNLGNAKKRFNHRRVRQAVPTKQRWDQDRADLQKKKNYITKECVDWLKKFLGYGKSTLQRTERPRLSLLRRSPSSPVVCHATGFYPDRVVVFWRRDGQELHEQVDSGEVLPNHDGTFQVSGDLNLKAVPQEDWGRYECVVQLKGIEDISTPLDPALIRTNWGDKVDILVFILRSVACVAVAAATAFVGVFAYQKRDGSDTSSEGQSPAPEAQPLNTGRS
ncbi:unnamed protein product [Boreogadus saida]